MDTRSDRRFVSYSANNEDVMIHRVFGGRRSGFFVDVGAAHPVFENDTKALYDAGWSGINIEPQPEFFAALVEHRPQDNNICIAISDSDKDVTDFFEIAGTGLSTCNEAQAMISGQNRIVRRRSVRTRSLKSILEEAKPLEINLLKVDVEGYEFNVLNSNDWTRFRPQLLITEATYPESSARRDNGVRTLLETQGYVFVYFDGLNDFFVERDFSFPADAFTTPPNIFDEFETRESRDLRQHVENLTQELEGTKVYLQSVIESRSDLENHLAELRRKNSSIFCKMYQRFCKKYQR
jgi:FkbM family methyltransferase